MMMMMMKGLTCKFCTVFVLQNGLGKLNVTAHLRITARAEKQGWQFSQTQKKREKVESFDP